MKVVFQSIEFCGYLDEFFRDYPWQVVCDRIRHLLYTGFSYRRSDSSITYVVIVHTYFDSLIGTKDFDLDVTRFIDSVREEYPDA